MSMEQAMQSQMEGSEYAMNQHYENILQMTFDEMELYLIKLEQDRKDKIEKEKISAWFIDRDVIFIKNLNKYKRGIKLKNLLAE